MDQAQGENTRSLKPERSNLSDYSLDSTPTITSSSPPPPLQHRPGYRRIASMAEEDTSYRGADADLSPTIGSAGNGFGESIQGRGLAIDNVSTQRRVSVARTPVGPKSSPNTPGMGDPLLSPTSTRVGFRGLESHFEDDHEDEGDLGHSRSNTSLYQPFTANSDRESLHRNNLSSARSVEPSGGGRDFDCKTKQNIHQGRRNWLAVTILVLAIYSSVFSGLWLLIAIRKPRYGRHITTTGKLTPSTASLLCAAFAKSIELSFVTVFVTFLGQVLSRRAFRTRSKGVTIAEMTMRAWIMQPGTLITHWETVRYAALTFLGMVSLTAALMAMVYTTASDALVAPKLKFGNLESRLVYGKVATQFANPDYIKLRCQTPIQVKDDETYAGSTCVEIEHAGQAYHNYLQYLSLWTTNIQSGNGSDSLRSRPRPTAMMYDNTTVQGSWINVENMTEVSARFGSRIINNVSMAMPHSGVFAAARDPLNNIIQPQDLAGLGEYLIRASVPSPTVNVLCASMSKEDLAPMVYTEWPYPKDKVMNVTGWPDDFNITATPSWLNKTAVDDVFGFGEKYGRRHPVFPKYPIAYNTILNTSKSYTDSIYLLATSPQSTFMLCSIRQSLTPDCSTEYRASLSGGSIYTFCEDESDALSYRKSDPSATNGVLNLDWINVAISWATSLSLNAGITDGQASNARLLTQLVPTTPSLNPSLPSIAEALAVLAGCTLLLSSIDAPFIHTWNYSTTVPTLNIPQYQAFNASLRSQDYASGGTQHWQGIFYLVLALIFVTNVFCLVYFLIRGGLVTDFIEPQNLFSLSINSPPSRSLEGSCGGGPEGEQFETSWFIKLERERDHFYIQESDTQPVRRKKTPKPLDYELDGSPSMNMYTKLSSKRTSIL